ncbi:flagellar hook-length control protein FliK [Bacillus niacini]|uniref:Flagellar hook-length control protein FliK n=1 Tax=Neobacillus niacini TaxID=86668 RepID=A0A852TGI2_9BACI|nr:flagellar hook-length control protein FliK [Neobacillus niacini]NYE06727.1 flagellar hook-length control protein FliK [Neobacillus niacini]
MDITQSLIKINQTNTSEAGIQRLSKQVDAPEKSFNQILAMFNLNGNVSKKDEEMNTIPIDNTVVNDSINLNNWENREVDLMELESILNNFLSEIKIVKDFPNSNLSSNLHHSSQSIALAEHTANEPFQEIELEFTKRLVDWFQNIEINDKPVSIDSDHILEKINKIVGSLQIKDDQINFDIEDDIVQKIQLALEEVNSYLGKAETTPKANIPLLAEQNTQKSFKTKPLMESEYIVDSVESNLSSKSEGNIKIANTVFNNTDNGQSMKSDLTTIPSFKNSPIIEIKWNSPNTGDNEQGLINGEIPPNEIESIDTSKSTESLPYKISHVDNDGENGLNNFDNNHAIEHETSVPDKPVEGQPHKSEVPMPNNVADNRQTQKSEMPIPSNLVEGQPQKTEVPVPNNVSDSRQTLRNETPVAIKLEEGQLQKGEVPVPTKLEIGQALKGEVSVPKKVADGPPLKIEFSRPDKLEDRLPLDSEVSVPNKLEDGQILKREVSVSSKIEEGQPLKREFSVPDKFEDSKSQKIEVSEPDRLEGSQPVKSEAALPNKLEEGQPQKSEMSKSDRLEGSQPIKSEAVLPNKLEEGKPQKSEMSKPEKQEGSQPVKSEAALPNKLEEGQPLKSEMSEPEKQEGSQPVKNETALPNKLEEGQPLISEGSEPDKQEGSQPVKSEAALLNKVEEGQPLKSEGSKQDKLSEAVLPNKLEERQPQKIEVSEPDKLEKGQSLNREVSKPYKLESGQTQMSEVPESLQVESDQLLKNTESLSNEIESGQTLPLLHKNESGIPLKSEEQLQYKVQDNQSLKAEEIIPNRVGKSQFYRLEDTFQVQLINRQPIVGDIPKKKLDRESPIMLVEPVQDWLYGRQNRIDGNLSFKTGDIKPMKVEGLVNQSRLEWNKEDNPVVSPVINQTDGETSIMKGSISFSKNLDEFSSRLDTVSATIPQPKKDTSIDTKTPQTSQNLMLTSFVPEVSKFADRYLRILKGQSGSTEAKFNLFPEHLGHLEVKIVSQDGQVQIQIVTDTSVAKESLEGQLHQLRQSLQTQGLQVQKLEIVQQLPGSFDSSQTGLSFSQGGSSSSQQHPTYNLNREQTKNGSSGEEQELEKEHVPLTYGGITTKSATSIDFTA